ncbi:probable cinnamyl alcohol dehydrogenase isoform X2 [Physcomitrium patens]|uniref:probable cinnamyl alcohol dehydrogenase isoform X2 n=1 Tax=Physcomitrium patens TaxID=3218 RepID=UPI003CCE3436
MAIIDPFVMHANALKSRVTRPNDVTMKVKYCGICHSDVCQIRYEWGASEYPMVPGHEVVGVMKEVGCEVADFKVGQTTGVRCMVWSCQTCESCDDGLEQYCPKKIWTYNGVDTDGTPTYGGYSTEMVCDRKYVLGIPENCPLDAASPFLCAGITTFSPMKYYGMTEKGKSLGVIGLGGLGRMAVKCAKAFGLRVTVFSTSPGKEKESRELLGADDFIISTDKEKIKAAESTIDNIIDTVSAVHPVDVYLGLLKTNGKFIMVGIPESPLQFSPNSVISWRRCVGGSLLGGVAETQEILDFCGIYHSFELQQQMMNCWIVCCIQTLEAFCGCNSECS